MGQHLPGRETDRVRAGKRVTDQEINVGELRAAELGRPVIIILVPLQHLLDGDPLMHELLQGARDSKLRLAAAGPFLGQGPAGEGLRFMIGFSALHDPDFGLIYCAALALPLDDAGHGICPRNFGDSLGTSGDKKQCYIVFLGG